eukprot:TRINITY_DN26093_c0_g1_i1.p1 TRINITY_DN26093_c0_g1~~TRINITY_DN26093_c0_g1_i1.p1  ORF type:complete len:499 (+),score=115.10 TRINITY_DN26093_c0_g1_i1:67-1563(+)
MSAIDANDFVAARAAAIEELLRDTAAGRKITKLRRSQRRRAASAVKWCKGPRKALRARYAVVGRGRYVWHAKRFVMAQRKKLLAMIPKTVDVPQDDEGRAGPARVPPVPTRSSRRVARPAARSVHTHAVVHDATFAHVVLRVHGLARAGVAAATSPHPLLDAARFKALVDRPHASGPVAVSSMLYAEAAAADAERTAITPVIAVLDAPQDGAAPPPCTGPLGTLLIVPREAEAAVRAALPYWRVTGGSAEPRGPSLFHLKGAAAGEYAAAYPQAPSKGGSAVDVAAPLTGAANEDPWSAVTLAGDGVWRWGFGDVACVLDWKGAAASRTYGWWAKATQRLLAVGAEDWARLMLRDAVRPSGARCEATGELYFPPHTCLDSSALACPTLTALPYFSSIGRPLRITRLPPASPLLPPSSSTLRRVALSLNSGRALHVGAHLCAVTPGARPAVVGTVVAAVPDAGRGRAGGMGYVDAGLALPCTLQCFHSGAVAEVAVRLC